MENMYTRITKIEQLLMERKEPEKSTTNVNLDIAIYGLYTPNDITISVYRLFEDMNLSNAKCVFAYRTPFRPDSNRSSVVMAVMRCLQDKPCHTGAQKIHPSHASVSKCVYQVIENTH